MVNLIKGVLVAWYVNLQKKNVFNKLSGES